MAASSWRNFPASSKQIALLTNLGIRATDLTRGEASDLITREFERTKHKTIYEDYDSTYIEDGEEDEVGFASDDYDGFDYGD